MKKLKVFYNAWGKRSFAGILAEEKRHIFFEYAPKFIAQGTELSPLKLPLKSGIFEGPAHFRGGLFGLFSDSLPDAWGSLLLDKKLRQKGLSYEALSPLDRMSLIGSNPVGALEYEPSDAAYTEDFAVHPDSLADEADAILDGRQSGLLDELVVLNGSAGGARPKITALVSDDKKTIIRGSQDVPPGFSPWIIKLSNSADRKEAGLHEYVCSLLARKCGIAMPETYLFPSRTCCGHFGVKRFDRNGSQKIHIHSAGGLLHADFRIPSLDYAGLLKLTQILTRNYNDVEQMVRLMIFNVRVGNKDDHSKNFSFMLDKDNSWKLAPAYDLTRSNGINGEQTAMVNGKGADITDDDLVAEAVKAGISKRKAREMIEEVSSCLAGYDKVLADARSLASDRSGEA